MIIILMGVAGSGKTRVGQALSELTGWVFLDADSYHSQASIEKMARCEPLNDADRAPWLNALSSIIQAQVEQGEPMILACSALKQSYRAQLSRFNPQAVRFVYLKVSLELLKLRLGLPGVTEQKTTLRLKALSSMHSKRHFFMFLAY
jgi:gluconokinase